MTNSNLSKAHTEARTFKKLALPVTVAALIGLAAAPAAAKSPYSGSGHSNATFDYAKVVDVQPIYETYEVNKPVEQCWDERVKVHDRGYRKNHNSKTPEVLGAIIGGAIGNRVGKRGGGKARDVATVVGAVLGGSIARDVKHSNRNNRHGYNKRGGRYETVQRCELRDSYTTRKEVVGYDVAYKYRGNVFHTELDQHPGNEIKVKVTVNPV